MRLGPWRDIAGLWQSFNKGIVVGMGLPLLALAGILGGVYLWTRRIPFLANIEDRDGKRRLILELMEPAEAQAAYQRRRAELQALRERIRTEVEAAIDEVETECMLELVRENLWEDAT